jgi:hypothetical protein
MNLQRTANSVLTVCLSQRDNRKRSLIDWQITHNMWPETYFFEDY